MSSANNSVQLFGRLCADPNGRDINTKNGAMRMVRFNVACQRRGKDAGADFPSCTAYGKTAEFIEKYFKKGSLIVINGRIQTGSYTAQNGTKIYTTDVVVDDWGFGGSKSDNQTSNSAPAQSAPQNNAPQNNNNDIFGGFSTEMPSELPFA